MSVMQTIGPARKEIRARIASRGRSEFDKPINLKPWREWKDVGMKPPPNYKATRSAGLSIEPSACRLVPHLLGLTPKKMFRQIVKVVCDGEDVRIIDVLSPRRWGELILSRHLVMYLACELTTLSLNQIGSEMGGRDHTTIMHGRNKIRADIKTDEGLRAKVDVYKQTMAQFSQGTPVHVDEALATGWTVQIVNNSPAIIDG